MHKGIQLCERERKDPRCITKQMSLRHSLHTTEKWETLIIMQHRQCNCVYCTFSSQLIFILPEKILRQYHISISSGLSSINIMFTEKFKNIHKTRHKHHITNWWSLLISRGWHCERLSWKRSFCGKYLDYVRCVIVGI